MKKKKWLLPAVCLLALVHLYFAFQYFHYKTLYRHVSENQRILAIEFDRMAVRTTRMQDTLDRLPFFAFVEYASRKRSPVFHKILDSAFRHARKYNLDPYLLLSLIHHESGFNPEAVSGKGACGLMQVNLAVWKEHLQLEEERIFEVDYNIDIGCRIFQQYLTEAEGDLERALYRYNNGYIQNGNVAYPHMVLKGKFAMKPLITAS